MNTQDTVHRKSAAELRIRRVMDALEKNNMQAYYAPTCADAVKSQRAAAAGRCDFLRRQRDAG